METHLRRFFIEIYDDPNMYNDYINGKVFLNRELYSKWHKEIQERNKIFAKSIKEINRPLSRELVVESALSENLTISEYLFRKSKVEVSDFEIPQISKIIPGNEKYHYICNGCFVDTFDKINQVLERGSFTVGICCEKKTKLFKEISTYYNQLKNVLLNNGYYARSFESNTNRKNRVYLLMYDSIQDKHPKK